MPNVAQHKDTQSEKVLSAHRVMKCHINTGFLSHLPTSMLVNTLALHNPLARKVHQALVCIMNSLEYVVVFSGPINITSWQFFATILHVKIPLAFINDKSQGFFCQLALTLK